MSESNQKPEGCSLFPKTFWGALSVAFICGTVLLIFFHLASPKPEEPRRLWTPIVVETNGAQTILGDTRQMEFWTPSANTRKYLKATGDSVRDKEKWQIISSDDTVFQFGALLHSNRNILGYRRVEVWGHGRTGFKPGWWWSVNVTTNCGVSELTHAYQDFWNPPSPIFIEVIDNRGSDK
jgi:hypothetical protein